MLVVDFHYYHCCLSDCCWQRPQLPRRFRPINLQRFQRLLRQVFQPPKQSTRRYCNRLVTSRNLCYRRTEMNKCQNGFNLDLLNMGRPRKRKFEYSNCNRHHTVAPVTNRLLYTPEDLKYNTRILPLVAQQI